MENFNHERYFVTPAVYCRRVHRPSAPPTILCCSFVLGATSNRYARICIEDAIKYARYTPFALVHLVEHQSVQLVQFANLFGKLSSDVIE